MKNIFATYGAVLAHPPCHVQSVLIIHCFICKVCVWFSDLDLDPVLVQLRQSALCCHVRLSLRDTVEYRIKERAFNNDVHMFTG